MALGKVTMTDTDGNIGSSTTVDVEKICGLLFDISGQSDFWTKGQGVNAAEYLKDTVVEINSLDDAVKLGITAYTDESSSDDSSASTSLLSGIPYYHISQFFTMAGGTGRLFIAFADCSKDWSAILDMQRTANGVISQFGVWTEQKIWKKMDSTASQYTIALVGDLESIAEQMANDYHSPASILLSGNSSKVQTADGESSTVKFSEIADAYVDARYVSVLLSQSMDTEVKKMQASLESTTPVGVVGLALGTLTQASVAECIGRVSTFDLVSYIPAVEMGFGDSTVEKGVIKNATPLSALSMYQLEALDEKGYIFTWVMPGHEGHVYFTSDRTCSSGDYCTIARNRAINKSRRLVRSALLEFVNSPVAVDPSTGNISSAQATYYSNKISDALSSMATALEISSVGTVSVPTTQSILKTNTLKVSYTIIPYGCAKEILCTEGLSITK